MEIVNIDIPNHEYNAYIGRNLSDYIASILSESSNNKNIFIVTDSYFQNGYAKLISDSLKEKGFFPYIHVMKGSKISKSFS